MCNSLASCLLLMTATLAGCGRVGFSRLDASMSDAERTPDLDAAGSQCVMDVCSSSVVVYDIGLGLERNLIVGAGMQTITAQLGVDGWWYHYHPRVRFGSYTPLASGDMDPGNYVLMERARDDRDAGWFSGVPGAPGDGIGERGAVWRESWDGPAVRVVPQNDRQPVLEWRAPLAGVAELSLEASVREAPEADMVWDVFVRRAGSSELLVSTYLSGTTTSDRNGVDGTLATRTSPWSFSASTEVQAGDSYFIHVRVGDDDAFDAGSLRGAIRFVARP